MSLEAMIPWILMGAVALAIVMILRAVGQRGLPAAVPRPAAEAKEEDTGIIGDEWKSPPPAEPLDRGQWVAIVARVEPSELNQYSRFEARIDLEGMRAYLEGRNLEAQITLMEECAFTTYGLFVRKADEAAAREALESFEPKTA